MHLPKKKCGCEMGGFEGKSVECKGFHSHEANIQLSALQFHIKKKLKSS